MFVLTTSASQASQFLISLRSIFHSLLLLSSSLKALSSVRNISSTTPDDCESVDWGFWLSSKRVLDSVESAKVSVSCKLKKELFEIALRSSSSRDVVMTFIKLILLEETWTKNYFLIAKNSIVLLWKLIKLSLAVTSKNPITWQAFYHEFPFCEIFSFFTLLNFREMRFKLRSAMNYRGNINSHKLYVIYTLLPYVIANYTAEFSHIFLKIPGINYRYIA